MVIASSFLSNQDTVFPQLTNSTQLRHAYTSVLTVTMASDQSFYETFRELQINHEIRSPVAVTQVMLPSDRSGRGRLDVPLHTNPEPSWGIRTSFSGKSQVTSIGYGELNSAGAAAVADLPQHRCEELYSRSTGK